MWSYFFIKLLNAKLIISNFSAEIFINIFSNDVILFRVKAL